MLDWLLVLLAVLFLVHHLWVHLGRKVYLSEADGEFVLENADQYIPVFQFYQPGGFFFNHLMGIYANGDALGVYRTGLAAKRFEGGWMIEIALDEFESAGMELLESFPFLRLYRVRGREGFRCTGGSSEASETGLAE